MSDKDGKRLRTLAREIFDRDTGTISQVGIDPNSAKGKGLRSDMGNGQTPDDCAATLGAGMAGEYRQGTERRLRMAKAAVSELVDELDDALAKMEASALKFTRATDGMVTELRARRLGFSQEVREALSALNDASKFLSEASASLGAMRELVDLGQKLHALFGAHALDRLAEALLIAMERRPA